MEPGNLFANAPMRAADETSTALAAAPGLLVERVVSTGQTSPADGSWYDQSWTEWVAVLAGTAEILFEDEDAPRRLNPGDHLLIAPHRCHRVVSTDPEHPTIWLAVHYGAGLR